MCRVSWTKSLDSFVLMFSMFGRKWKVTIVKQLVDNNFLNKTAYHVQGSIVRVSWITSRWWKDKHFRGSRLNIQTKKQQIEELLYWVLWEHNYRIKQRTKKVERAMPKKVQVVHKKKIFFERKRDCKVETCSFECATDFHFWYWEDTLCRSFVEEQREKL